MSRTPARRIAKNANGHSPEVEDWLATIANWTPPPVDLETLRHQLQDVLEEIDDCGYTLGRTRLFEGKMVPLLANPVLSELEREVYLNRAKDFCRFPKIETARAAVAREAARRTTAPSADATSSEDAVAERPRVRTPLNQFYDAKVFLETLWTAIQAANVPASLFRFGDALVWIESDAAARPFTRLLRGPHVRHWLRQRLFFYTVGDKGTELPVDGPPLVEDVMVTPSPPLPVLRRLVTTPVLTRDGAVLTTPGYDAGSQVYYQPPAGFVMPPVPETPTAAERTAALALVLEVIQDFPFVTEADRTNALAALLTIFLRDLIDGPTPLFLFSKPTPGTGSTLAAEAFISLATGQDPAVNGQGEHDAEWRKKLTAALLRAPAVVLFDNLGGVLESDSLARAVTARTWQDRVLGENRQVDLPITCTWLATANNLALEEQWFRRVVPIHMDANVERPWLLAQGGKTYTHPDLLAWVARERPRLVAACLTLCRAWVVAGRPANPATAPTLGKYEAWVAVVGGVLVTAGRTDFLGNLDALYATADSDADEKRPFLAEWWIAYQGNEVEARTLYTRLLRRDYLTAATEPPCALSLGGKDEVGSVKSLGWWLRKHRGQVTTVGALTWRPGQREEVVAVKIEAAGTRHRPTWKLVRIGLVEGAPD